MSEDLSDVERGDIMKNLFIQSKENDKTKMALRDDVKFIKKVTYLVLPDALRKQIDAVVREALSAKTNPLDGIREEFPNTVLDSLFFYTRSKNTQILDMVTKPTQTGLWKAFKDRFINEKAPISMAFHAKGLNMPWVITNQRTGYVAGTDEELLGSIIIHVRGKHQAVYVMPLNIYMKED